MPSFTPEQLADVYVWRRKIRDMSNEFIRELKPVRLNFAATPKLPRSEGSRLKIHVHGVTSDWASNSNNKEQT